MLFTKNGLIVQFQFNQIYVSRNTISRQRDILRGRMLWEYPKLAIKGSRHLLVSKKLF
jgi:hypothetical protein